MGGSFLFVSTFSVTLTVKLILKGGEGDLFEVGKINKVILCFNKPINSSFLGASFGMEGVQFACMIR